MRHWREEQFQAAPDPADGALGASPLGLSSPLARASTASPPASPCGLLAWLGRRGRFRRLPLAGGWTGTRDLPAPQGRTFMSQWRHGGRAVSEARAAVLARLRHAYARRDDGGPRPRPVRARLAAHPAESVPARGQLDPTAGCLFTEWRGR